MTDHDDSKKTSGTKSDHPHVVGLSERDDAPIPGKPETYPKESFAADPNKLPMPEEGGGELEVPLRLDSTAPPMYRAYNENPGEAVDPRDGMGGETGTGPGAESPYAKSKKK